MFVESKILWLAEPVGPNSHTGTFFFESLIEAIVFTLLPILIVSKYYDADLEEIGLTLQSFKRSLLVGIAVGLLLWGVVSIFDVGIRSIWGKGPKHPYVQMLEMSDASFSYFIVLFDIVLLGPVSEEVYIRGFAYTIFKKRFGKFISLILSSLLFTGFHFNIRGAIQIFIASVGLTLLFERTKSLVSVITAHAVMNLCSLYIGNGKL